MAINLPPGYQLDSSASTAHIALPEGYTIDKPKEDTSQAHIDPLAFERGPEYPTAAMTDTSLNDAMFVQGIAGLGKAGASFAAPQLTRVANNQMLKSLGGSMGQIRQMTGSGGREALDEAAQYGMKHGLGDIFSTSMGRDALLKKLEETAGSKIGALRNEAGTVLNPENIQSQIMNDPNMAKYLGEGSYSGEKGGLTKALADIREIGGANPSHADLADASTFINKGAAGSKLYQPVTAQTDVANALSRINNEGIATSLGPVKNTDYKGALQEYSNLKPLQHLQERGELREMASRGGFDPWKGTANTVGYRATAKGANLAGNVMERAANALEPLTSDSVSGNLMKILGSNPQELGRYAAPLQQAAKEGGSQAVAAMHYILSTTHPDYNQMTQNH